MTELKIKIDDCGYLYAETQDGTIHRLVARVYNNPYFAPIRLGKEVEEEDEDDCD